MRLALNRAWSRIFMLFSTSECNSRSVTRRSFPPHFSCNNETVFRLSLFNCLLSNLRLAIRRMGLRGSPNEQFHCHRNSPNANFRPFGPARIRIAGEWVNEQLASMSTRKDLTSMLMKESGLREQSRQFLTLLRAPSQERGLRKPRDRNAIVLVFHADLRL